MDRKILKEEVNEIKRQNWEETKDLLIYGLSQYFKSLLKYGRNSKITNNNIKVLKMYWDNLQEEENYYALLLHNQNLLSTAETLDFLADIDNWKEQFLKYLYDCLDSLEDSYEMGIEHRAKLPRKDLVFLTETPKYRKEIVRLLLGNSFLQDYFKYPQEFWSYMQNRTIVLNDGIDDYDFIGVYPKLDKDNHILAIKMYIPQIIDLQTMLVTIHEYNHAYMLYFQLGEKMQNYDYEALAKGEEARFLETYFEPAYQRIFKK